MATTVMSASRTAEEVDQLYINDKRFIRDLSRLKDLRSFVIQEAITITPAEPDVLCFGGLNSLRFKLEGRAPTQQEWAELEVHTQKLFSLLDDRLRKRFILGGIPTWMSILAIVLAVFAAFALIESVVLFGRPSQVIGPHVLPFYVGWLLCLGAIGAVAFIGMNALSIQQDVTFDITNTRLMLLRITLGALFGLVLTLPFGFEEYMGFVRFIVQGPQPGSQFPQPNSAKQAAMLLLPFVLGFSTPLVIMILNRLIDAVQGFFGKSEADHRGEISAGASHGGRR